MKNSVKTFLAIGVFIVASVLGRIVYEEFARPRVQNFASHRTHDSNYKTYNLDTEYTDYSASTTKDTVKVKTVDKISNQKHEYNVKFDSKAGSFGKNSNETYLKQNKELVSQASKAYGFIISNDYKAVKYCSQYYPVNNLKKKFDARFQTKRQKAENILNNAFGKTGAKDFANTILQQTTTLQVFQKQMEDDYLGVKKLAAQDGEPNFTRKQYCKMLDESADFAVEEDYKKFQLMVPNF